MIGGIAGCLKFVDFYFWIHKNHKPKMDHRFEYQSYKIDHSHSNIKNEQKGTLMEDIPEEPVFVVTDTSLPQVDGVTMDELPDY